MITTSCPRCAEAIRLPTENPPSDATAQCPWCGELFPASELCNNLPPMVELIAADGQPLYVNGETLVEPESIETADVADEVNQESTEKIDIGTEIDFDDQENETEQVANAEDQFNFVPNVDEGQTQADMDGNSENQWAQELGDLETDSSMPSFDLSNDGEVATPIAPMKVKASPPPPRQKKTSPVRTLVGFALGPVIAGIIAWPVLWYFDRDLGFWPFRGRSTSAEPHSRAAPVIASHQSDVTRPRVKPSSEDIAKNGLGVALANSASKPAIDSISKGSSDRSESELDGTTPKDSDAATLDDSFEAVAKSKATPSESGELELSLPSTFLKPEESGSANRTDPGEVSYPEQVDPKKTRSKKSRLDSRSTNIGEAGSFADKSSAKLDPGIQTEIGEETSGDSVAGKIEAILSGEDVDLTLDKPKAKIELPTRIRPESIVAFASDKTIEKAKAKLRDLMTFEGRADDRTRLLARTYAALAAVGAEEDASHNVETTKLLRDLSKSGLMTELGDAADQWLDYPKRPTDGVFLFGVAQQNSQGAYIRIATPSGGQRMVKVRGGNVPVSTRVAAVGQIILSGSSKAVELVAVEPIAN